MSETTGIESLSTLDPHSDADADYICQLSGMVETVDGCTDFDEELEQFDSIKLQTISQFEIAIEFATDLFQTSEGDDQGLVDEMLECITSDPTTEPTMNPTHSETLQPSNSSSSGQISTDEIIIIATVGSFVLIVIVCGVVLYGVYKKGVSQGKKQAKEDQKNDIILAIQGELSMMSEYGIPPKVFASEIEMNHQKGIEVGTPNLSRLPTMTMTLTGQEEGGQQIIIDEDTARGPGRAAIPRQVPVAVNGQQQPRYVRYDTESLYNPPIGCEEDLKGTGTTLNTPGEAKMERYHSDSSKVYRSESEARDDSNGNANENEQDDMVEAEEE